MIDENVRMQQLSDEELPLWKELYDLHNEAANRESDRIDAENLVTRGEISILHARAARRALHDVESRIHVMGQKIRSLGTARMLWQSHTVELGVEVQTSQEVVHTLQSQLWKLVRGPF